VNCSDCGASALYVFDDPGALPVLYCETCLPQPLRVRVAQGTLNRVSQPKESAKKTAVAKE
jgi:hypothetical protein